MVGHKIQLEWVTH